MKISISSSTTRKSGRRRLFKHANSAGVLNSSFTECKREKHQSRSQMPTISYYALALQIGRVLFIARSKHILDLRQGSFFFFRYAAIFITGRVFIILLIVHKIYLHHGLSQVFGAVFSAKAMTTVFPDRRVLR